MGHRRGDFPPPVLSPPAETGACPARPPEAGAGGLHHRLISEHAGDVIWLLDLASWRFTYVSPSVFRLLGYTPQEVMAQPPEALLPPEGVRRLARELPPRVAALEAGDQSVRGQTHEVDQLRKDGGLVTTEMVTTLLTDGQGRVREVLGITRDITARRQAEEALRESRRALATLLANLPGVAYRCRLDADWTMEFVSEGCLELTGYRVDELLGNRVVSFGQITHPDDRAMIWREVMAAVEDGRPFQLEYRLLTRRGEERWIWEKGRAVRSAGGEVVALEGFLFDVTDRKRAEEALRRSEEKMAKAFKASPAWISISTVAEGRFLEVNDIVLATFGRTRDEMVGHTSEELGVWLDPGDRRRALAELARRGRLRNLEVPMRAKGGEVRTVLWSAEQMEIGGEACLVSVMLDISDQVKAQAEKAKLEAQLRHAQKMEAVGTLAGGIAHDFNNIMAAIMGYAELAQDLCREGRSNLGELDQVLGAAERAKKLVKQLLAFSRRGEAADFKVLDLNLVVRAALAIFERTLPKMIGIETRLAGGPLWTRADAGQLEQVLLNLVNNARDAMPEGGHLILATRRLAEGEATAAAPGGKPPAGDWLELMVADDGHGMDPATRERAFEPFFTTKEVGKGSGLGLSTAYGIVEAHGGSIGCESAPGEGTRFRILLPAAT